MRVVHCFRAPVGGVFRHVCDLAHAQAGSGAQVGLICDAHTGGEHAAGQLRRLAEVCALGVQRLPMHRLPHWSDAAVFRDAGRALRAARPDIVHGHGAKGGAYARLLARRLGARAVYTPHGGTLHYGAGSLPGALYLGLERLLRRYTHGAIFESEFSATAYARKIGVLDCPRAVIHNGLREAEFAGLTPAHGARHFVFVGELRRLKGVEVLLQALALLAREREISLLLAGAGPDAQRFARTARRLGLDGAIHASPPVYPAARAFVQGQCVVAPSLAESFPYVVLEAAAAGMPLLTTRVGGIPEIFGPYAQRLLAPGDPGALAAAMRRTLEDPEDARRFAARLRERVRSLFHVDAMVRATDDLYTRALAPRTGGGGG